jgi:hypothetical protein
MNVLRDETDVVGTRLRQSVLANAVLSTADAKANTQAAAEAAGAAGGDDVEELLSRWCD